MMIIHREGKNERREQVKRPSIVGSAIYYSVTIKLTPQMSLEIEPDRAERLGKLLLGAARKAKSGPDPRQRELNLPETT